MPIIEEYDAIGKRLRELKSAAPKSTNEITDLEHWRDLARQTARTYVENRRRSASPTPTWLRRRGQFSFTSRNIRSTETLCWALSLHLYAVRRHVNDVFYSRS